MFRSPENPRTRSILVAAALSFVVPFIGLGGCFRGTIAPDPTGGGTDGDDVVDPSGVENPPGGDGASGNLPCIACHSAALGERRRVANTSGQGVHSHTGAAPTNADCLVCHETTLHAQGQVRLWANPAVQNAVISLEGDPGQIPVEADKLSPFCAACHGNTQHATHTVPGDWQPACVACHNLHNPDSENLSLVRTSIHNETLDQDQTVAFTARTGPGSFADGAGADDGVCQACHTATSYHRQDGTGTAHNEGADCTACHTHAAGFIPSATSGSCIACHSTVQGARPAVVRADGSGGHHLASAKLNDADCIVCHDQRQHQQGTVRLWTNPNNPTTSLAVGADPTRLAPFCASCHDAKTHPTIHATGQSWQPTCTECHATHQPGSANHSLVRTTIHNDTLNQDTAVVFTARTGTGSFSDGVGANNGVCQVCHTATNFHRQDGSGTAHNEGADCTGCHTHQTGFMPSADSGSCITCHSTAQGARGAVVRADGGGGHHLASALLSDADCIVCHDQRQHQQGTVRVWADPNQATTSIAVGTDPSQLTPFCASCHDAKTHPTIHTTGQSWQPACTECHAPHQPGSANLSLVRTPIRNRTLNQDAPVVFTSTVGTGSFSDGVGANNGVCQVCHTATTHHRQDGSGTAHNEGADCTTCHTHQAGFIPSANAGSCIACHSTAQGARPSVVRADGGGGHHLASALLSDADCIVCHDQRQHQQGTVRVWTNPNNPTTSIAVGADPTQLAPFCASCHDAKTHPTIHTTGQSWQPTCTECHAPHEPASLNRSLVRTTIHNDTLNQDRPVVFTARTGPGSFSDGVGANNDVCQVCHTTTAYHRQDGSGTAHNEGADCTGCHSHQAGFIPSATAGSCIACHSTTQGSRPSVVRADGGGGHHLAAALMSDADCIVCHDQRQHQQGTVRLWANPNQPTTSIAVGTDPALLTPFCASCHDAMTHPTIHTPGGSWQPACTECHAPHQRTSVNLSLVRTSVRNRSLNQDKAVVFTATTGAGSFSDGVGANNGVCQVCHTATNYHRQDGTGTAHNEGADCTGCHTHQAGFMPSAGSSSCTGCHSTSQNARRAVVSEFSRASHHVSDLVTDGDCTVCHDMSAHQQGSVRLRNVDRPNDAAAVVALTGNPFISATEAAKVEPFCIACHDANGANGAAPFADGRMPSVIVSAAWSSSSHSTGQTTCIGDGETFGCHASGHGSVKKSMLAPATGSATGVTGDTLRQEEGLCYSCHDANGPATTNVQATFALATHHNVSSVDQADGSRVECVNCHNPHTVSAAAPLTNPDSGQAWTGGMTAFCLTCHDGTPPAGVVFSPTSAGTGFNKAMFLGTTHDVELGTDGCWECHDPHGSAQLAMLRGRYVVSDGNAYTTGDGDYAACFMCHTENAVTNQTNAFAELHSKHVRGERAPCIICHNVHGGSDAAEPGLIDFAFSTQHAYNIQFRSGSNASTAFSVNLGTNRGSCTLTCHGRGHSPETYQRSPVDTVP